MTDEMNELNEKHIKSLNISQDKSTQQYKSRGKQAKPQGILVDEIYDKYYDVAHTITNAVATDPNDPDGSIMVGAVITPIYNQERVFEDLERNAAYLWVANDAAAGGATLFVITSHKGGQHFGRETPIYPQQYKVYKNIYELRLRSTATINYRVSEYELGTL